MLTFALLKSSVVSSRAQHEDSVAGALGWQIDWWVARDSGEADITWVQDGKRQKRGLAGV